MYKWPTQYILEAWIAKTMYHGLSSVYTIPQFFYMGKSIELSYAIVDKDNIEVTAACDVNITVQFSVPKEIVEDSCCGWCAKKKCC
jgi:hypothetical protein